MPARLRSVARLVRAPAVDPLSRLGYWEQTRMADSESLHTRPGPSGRFQVRARLVCRLLAVPSEDTGAADCGWHPAQADRWPLFRTGPARWPLRWRTCRCRHLVEIGSRVPWRARTLSSRDLFCWWWGSSLIVFAQVDRGKSTIVRRLSKVLSGPEGGQRYSGTRTCNRV